MNAPRKTAPGKISPALEPLIVQRAGLGWSTRRISHWLKTEHAVDVSHVAIGGFLARAREGGAATAKTIVRSRLAGSLADVVDRLTRRAVELGEVADLARGEKDYPRYFKAVDLERKACESALRFSGAETPDVETDDPRPGDRIMAKMRRLLEASGAMPPPVDGDEAAA